VSTFRLFAKNLSEVRGLGKTLAFLEEDGWPCGISHGGISDIKSLKERRRTASGRGEVRARVMTDSKMMTTTRRNPTVTTVLSSTMTVKVKVEHSSGGWEDVEALWSDFEFGMARRGS